MKQTVLELTQSILASMDSDEVNSINDTVESYDIALLLRDVYYDIAVELNLTAHESLFELEASGDNAQPTLMYLPDNIQKLWWVKYNNIMVSEGDTNADYKEVCYKDYLDLLKMQDSLIEQTTDVGQMSYTMNAETFEIMYRSDKHPQYFTVIGNEIILFDSFNDAEDTTLQKSKTMCGGLVYPTFTLEDSFVADLDASQFPYFRNRAKVRAFAEKKQVENREAAAETRNQKIQMQLRKNRVNEGTALQTQVARYGRKGSNPSILEINQWK